MGLRWQWRLMCGAVLAAVCAADAAAQLQGVEPATPAAATVAPPAEKPAEGPTASELAKARDQRIAKLKDAVVQLTKEAQDLDKTEGEVVAPVFNRPHPALKGLGPDYATLVLNGMTSRFTGNQFRDAYIRWHLMAVVQKMPEDERLDSAGPLRRLVRDMPDSSVPAKQVPDHRYEPPDIAGKYFSLANSGNVVTGYPPFQKVIGPPASYEFMSAAQAAKVKANLEEAARLRSQFQTIIDKGAQQRNYRIRMVNHIIRQYRGELIYELLKSGKEDVVIDVMDDIDAMAKRKDPMALDLISYMYLAAFDGVLSRYQADTLQTMSRKLEASARANQTYVEYGGQDRNFADYAFHLIYLLQDGGGFFEAEAAPQPTGQRRSFRN